MVVKCEQVWQEISNYLENEVDSALRSAIEEHLRECKRCTAVLDGTRNILQLYGDERLFQPPLGFDWRLQARLGTGAPNYRRGLYGWLITAAALALISGGIALANSATHNLPVLRSEHADPGDNVPRDLAVLVVGDGKVFHVPGCRFLHEKNGKVRSLTAGEAIHEGYVPCTRCLRKYLAGLSREFLRKLVLASTMQ